MNSYKKQQGLTVIGWILVLALIAIFTLFFLKLFPIYLNSYKVSSILATLEEDHATGAMTPGEVVTTIVKRLNVNIVHDVSKDDIYIERAGNRMTIDIEYEVRKNLVGNIDVVVAFQKGIEVAAR